MAHIHNVLDTNLHFVIDPLTRELRIDTEVEKESKMVVIQYDHNSERVTFEIPKEVDGHDMSTCNVVQVHYLNVSADGRSHSAGMYEVKDLSIDPNNEEIVVGTWLISRNATQLAGTLNFLIRFTCVNAGNVDYVWNTAVYTDISVSSGIYNGEETAEYYADILEQWRQELFGLYEPSKILLPQQMVEVATINEVNMSYRSSILMLSEPLVAGETYIVAFNDKRYSCIATKVKNGEDEYGVCVGNLAITESGSDTGEPFVIVEITPGSAFLFTNAAGEMTDNFNIRTHKVMLYQTETDLIRLDASLSVEGWAADAKAVGDKIRFVEDTMQSGYFDLENSLLNLKEQVENMDQTGGNVDDEHIIALINERLGVIENGTY